MTTIARLLVASISLISTGSSLIAQTPRQIETLPLRRPKPLVSMAGTQVRPALDVIIAVLGQAGFVPDAVDVQAGEISASKQGTDTKDTVVIWLEWELAKPSERFNIFIETGRYEKFFGQTDLQRVALSTGEEQQRFGALRQAIITEAFRRGTS